MIRLRFLGSSLVVAAVFAATPAFAGPPLLCFPFDIGSARSLPMGTQNWQSIDKSYDASRLVADTIALLTPQTPVIVRMETLRRATVYASKHPQLAPALLDAFEARAGRSDATAGYGCRETASRPQRCATRSRARKGSTATCSCRKRRR